MSSTLTSSIPIPIITPTGTLPNIEHVDTNALKKLEFASEFLEIPYITETIKIINKKKLLYLHKIIDRPQITGKFSILLKDIELAIYIEAGIYEFTLVYGQTKNIITKLLPAIYNDKVYEIFANLDDTNVGVENKTLKNAIINGEVDPQMLAFLQPHDLHPERWKDTIRKRKLREDKKKNMATTDLYQCRKCGERKCQVTELQIRSIDEPTTKFITCLVCNNVFKK